MKNLVITSIVALGVAAPAVAQTLTVGQQAEVFLSASEDSSNDRVTFFGNDRINFSASNIHNPVAADIFEQLKAESASDK